MIKKQKKIPKYSMKRKQEQRQREKMEMVAVYEKLHTGHQFIPSPQHV